MAPRTGYFLNTIKSTRTKPAYHEWRPSGDHPGSSDNGRARHHEGNIAGIVFPAPTTILTRNSRKGYKSFTHEKQITSRKTVPISSVLPQRWFRTSPTECRRGKRCLARELVTWASLGWHRGETIYVLFNITSSFLPRQLHANAAVGFGNVLTHLSWNRTAPSTLVHPPDTPEKGKHTV